MKKIVIFIALTTLLFSCSSEELIIEEAPQKGDKELIIKPNIQASFDSKAIVTGQEFSNNDEICVRVTPNTPGDGILQNWPTYYRYDKTADKWNYYKLGTSSASKIYLGSEEHSYIAFYPAPKLVDDGQGGQKYDIEVINYDNGSSFVSGFGKGDNAGLRLSHPAIGTSLDGSSQHDLMIGVPYDVANPTVPPLVSKDKATAAVRFYHLLCKAEFIINKSADYANPGLVTEVVLVDNKNTFHELSSSSVDGSVVMIPTDPKAYTITNLKDAADNTIGFKNTNGVSANSFSDPASTNTVAKGLIIPRTATQNGNITFQIKIDGRVYTAAVPYDITATSGFKGNFLQATNYKFTFTVYPDAIRLDTVFIYDWSGGAVNNEPVILN